MTMLRSKNNHGLELTLTELAACHLERLRSCEMRAEVLEKAVQCLVDYLGALISGLAAPWSAALLRYAKVASPAKGTAIVMGLDIHLAAEIAAFTNAAIAHR